jgi:hypothetical protein
MVVENLTQRQDEFQEVALNLVAIRKFLKTHEIAAVQTLNSSRKDGRKAPPQNIVEAGSVRSIAAWLNKNDQEVMSVGKIETCLQIYDKLDSKLFKRVEHVDGGIKKGDELSIEDARALMRVDKEYQQSIAKMLDVEDLTYKEKGKLVSTFNDSSDDVKKEIISGNLKFTELDKNLEESPMNEFQMNLRFSKKILNLTNEMRLLKRSLFQFRNEGLFDNFSSQQRKSFGDKLFFIKKEYGELVGEIEKSMEALK